MFIHRELCRLVWRPQTARFSTKATDGKQPRRTHIKKAKPQPALDVAKLLEQLYSQRRPGTATSVGKARLVKASSTPLSSVTAAPVGPPKDPVEAKAEASAEEAQTKNTDSGVTDVSHTAKEVPLVETFVESPAETSHLPAETLETNAAVDSPAEPMIKTPQDVAAETKSTDTVVDISHAETLETSVEPTVAIEVDSPAQEILNDSTDSGPLILSNSAVEEPLTETVESSDKAGTSPQETLENRAAVAEGSVETTLETVADTTAQAVQTSSTEPSPSNLLHAAAEALKRTTLEPALETSICPQETIDGGAVEPKVDAAEDSPDQLVQTAADSGPVSISHTAEEETIIEPTVEASTCALEAVETKLDVAEEEVETATGVAAEPKVNAAEDSPEQLVQTAADSGPVSISHAAEEETIIEPTVEASTCALEAVETKLDVAEKEVETTIETLADTATSKDLEVINTTEEPSAENVIETIVEASTCSPESGAALSESAAEPTSDTTVADSLSHVTLLQNAQEFAPLSLDNKVESTQESSSVNVPVAEEVINSEQMTLESVTLHGVQVEVQSLESEELFQTNSCLDEKVEQELQELLVQTGSGAESRAAAETENPRDDESKHLSEVLSKWNSLSDDLQELEGESGTLVKELLWHVPAVISKTPDLVSGPPAGANRDSLHTEEKETEAEAMTLESITLANVKAEVRVLEPDDLLETRNELEKKAEVLAKEEKMEVTTKIEEEEDAVFDSTTEAELLSLDSIAEATEAIEAETSIILEAMFGSEQGSRQPPENVLDDPKQAKAISQEAEKDSTEREKSIVEAMTLESVTLAEVEASLGSLESDFLSETSNYLETEAEALAKEEKMEVKDEMVSEEATEALNIESLSLPEGEGLSEALQVDELMEELLFSVPGPIKGVTEGLIEPEAAGANIVDASVATGSVCVETLAEMKDDFSAPPTEMLQAQEMEEVEEVEGARTEGLENVVEAGTQTDLDPVQRLFLEKIREYSNMRKLNGGLLEAEPDYKKNLSEEAAKLQRLYGGGDLDSFPEFSFTEPETDQDSK
ncbi:uncharacterized protein LOC117811516 isoform X2 [Notolabrus celidotus]|uniref:uncharacterized protein LOC117811516 isoform X2 n=1 Tax=Notolabrus celidotus TaxID=1203425 RepID=UPI0014905D88|nr:uncharacterized protein LOC117811516 isoform X2 [Notolabrus celidotus]